MPHSDSDSLLNIASRLAGIGGWSYDVEADLLQWSDEMCALHGVPPGTGPTRQSALAFCAHEYHEKISSAFAACIKNGTSFDLEHEILKVDGTRVWIRCIGRPVRDDQGRTTAVQGAVQDISERKLLETELQRHNRARQIRSACSELMIRSQDEMALLRGVCELIVKMGGYALAFVGFALQDAACTIEPVAWAGDCDDYLQHMKFSWSDSLVQGRGPAGRTIRNNSPSHVADLTLDAGFAPARRTADRSGFKSLTALPLRDSGCAFGVLILYSQRVQPASSEEIKLLQELADDLAFGIKNIRAQNEQRRLHAAVVKIATSVSAATSKEFFENLCRNLAESVGAHGAFVAALDTATPGMARTLCAVVDGKLQDNFAYSLEETPCRNLIVEAACVVLDDVAARYPLSTNLKLISAESYVGQRIDDLKGEPLGLLFVLFKTRLDEAGFILSALQIFAARAAAELERVGADSRLRGQASILDKARDAIVIRGLDHRVQFWNKGAERLYGCSAAQAQSQLHTALVSIDPTVFETATRQVIELGDWSGELSCKRRDGTVLSVECRWTLVVDETTRAQSILAIDTDISKRKSAEREIHELAFYDPLTRLPNRQLLQDRLKLAHVAQARSRQIGALLFIDLDNFKALNDTLGHSTGDLLLQQVGNRIVSSVRESDTVAHFGGDEFVVMLVELGTDASEALQNALHIGTKIQLALRAPFRLGISEHHSTCSIGLTLLEDQSVSAGELLKRADMAMYQAKAGGRNALRVFSPDMQVAVSSRVDLEIDLRRALDKSELFLHYQPQVDNESRVTGAEALVRWQHPQRGLISPAEFIPIAEETGMILQLGHWVLERACRELAAWADVPGLAHLTMAVNVSVRQFRHPGFIDDVRQILSQTGVDPKRLKLELTESLLVDDVDVTIEKMRTLQGVGIGFSLDDFGTGYSSLAYLKRLPLEQLKIDRSFVRDIMADESDAAIARIIVALAKSLGMGVMAEGVETDDQHRFLVANGCQSYQGFLFSRPVPMEEFVRFASCTTLAGIA